MQRYNQFSTIITDDKQRRRYSTMYHPVIPRSSADIYIITKSADRLDLLSYQYYGDSRYWPVIARANLLHSPSLKIEPGIQIRIPMIDIDQIDTENL